MISKKCFALLPVALGLLYLGFGVGEKGQDAGFSSTTPITVTREAETAAKESVTEREGRGERRSTAFYESEMNGEMLGRLPAGLRPKVEIRKKRDISLRGGREAAVFEAYWDEVPIEGTRGILSRLDSTGLDLERNLGRPIADYRTDLERFPSVHDDAQRAAIDGSLRERGDRNERIEFSHRSWYPDAKERAIRPCLNYVVEYRRNDKEREETWCADAETGRILRRSPRRKTM